MAEETRDLRGTVAKVFYASATFSAGRLLPVRADVTRGGEVAFAGACFVKVGEAVTLRGKWTEHKKYGRQFSVESRVYTEAVDAAGLAAWLAVQGQGLGIGPVRAEKLAKEFGENFVGILRDNPEQFAIAARVPLGRVKQLSAEWIDHEEKHRVGSKLAAWGLTESQVETLYAKFKGGVVSLLEADPYMLLGHCEGIGFKRVDAIARKLGTPETHPGRLAAAVVHVLKEAQNDGSTCLPRTEAVNTAVGLLDSERDDMPTLLEAAVDELLADGKKLVALTAGEEIMEAPVHA